jgi:aminomethyltransferase
MVDFAGWEMPVQYAGIIEEHRSVRESCGIFDISHMGEFFVSGSGASAWLDNLLTNRASKLNPGEAQYSILLNERGGVIDDLYVYRLGDGEFLLIVNASMIETDAAWMTKHLVEGVRFEDASARLSALAVQGPKAAQVYADCFAAALPADRNRVVALSWSGENLWVCTTGYTGEAGFEVVRTTGKGVIPIIRQVMIASGIMIILSVILGFYVNQWWYALAAFVGGGLLFAGVTGICGMATLLSYLPWNRADR